MRRVSLFIAVVSLLVLSWGAFAASAREMAAESFVVAADLPSSPPVRDKSASVLQLYTFENGGNPDPQGWTSDDLTENLRNHCHVDYFIPALVGNQSLWCGTVVDPNDPETADWALPGYGDYWHQSWESRDFIAPDDGFLLLEYQIAWNMEGTPDQIAVEYRINDQIWLTHTRYETPSGSDDNSLFVFAGAGSVVRFRFRFQSDRTYSNATGDVAATGAFQLDELIVRDVDSNLFSYETFEAEAIGAEETLSGDWRGVVVPGFGDYTGLQAGNQVRQDDPATYNSGHFWSFFAGSPDQYECGADPQAALPVGGTSYFDRLHNEIRSPWIDLDLGAGPRSIRVTYDVYLDTPYDQTGVLTPYHRVQLFYRDAADNLLPSDFTPYYVGESQSWVVQRHQFNLPPDAVQVQVAFEVADSYNSACHRHAPLIDNVAVAQTTAFTVTRGFNDGDETLRWAIDEANTNPGPDKIDFSILDQVVVTATTPLPAITEAVHLDGFVQIGGRPNTLIGASDAVVSAGIVGNLPGNEPGLDIQADGCVIEGLSITGFGLANIRLQGDFNLVRGCWLGFDRQGAPQTPNASYALLLQNGGGGAPPAMWNSIGGPDPGDQNVLGSCLGHVINAVGCDQLVIQGNLVGVAPDGATAAGGLNGITVSGGGLTSILANVVSGNARSAFSAGLNLGTDADFVVQGNVIGLSGDQNSALPNAGAGIDYFGNATNAQLGGCGPDEGNVIAGNGGDGVVLQGEGAVTVLGNTIGTNAAGQRQDLGNGGAGVRLTFAAADLFAVGTENCGNLIAYNAGDGVHVAADYVGAYEILRNDVYANGGLEIDVSPFDDYAPPPPTLSDVYLDQDRVTATLTLADLPNVERTFNFFVSRECIDPSDPQAEVYVQRGAIATDGRGEINTVVTIYGTFFPGDALTATTTSLGEATSGLTACIPLINTPVGSNVVVPLPDQSGTAFPMTATFGNVTVEGITFGQPGQDTGAPPPEYINYGIYQFGTTATWDQGLEIGIDYDDSILAPWAEPHLQLLQMDMEAPGNVWFDITTTLDPVGNRISGQVGALGIDQRACFALVVVDGPTSVPTPRTRLQLLPNVPNPFNPATEIQYVLPRDGEPVTVDIYDLAGRHVRRLLAGTSQAGPHTLTWNGTDDNGRAVVSGVYPLRLVVGKEVRLQRLVLVK